MCIRDSTQCGLGPGLLPYQVASSSIQPFGHNRHLDSDLGQFTVTRFKIQFPIWPPLTPTSYLSPFLGYLMLHVFFHKTNGKNYFHFRFDRRKYSGFPPKTIGDYISWDTSMMANLVKIATCRALNSFSATDWLTQHTDKLIFYNLSNAANAMGR